jgi:hypothetical protein
MEALIMIILGMWLVGAIFEGINIIFESIADSRKSKSVE